MKVDNEVRDFTAFCVRSSTVIFFLAAIVARASGLVSPFILLTILLMALFVYDIFVCELRVEDRHTLATCVFYVMMIGLSLVAYWKS